MVVLFRPCSQAFGPSARTEGVCQLGHGENAFASVPRPFLAGQTRKEAEIVRLDGVPSATVMELALGTMPVENSVRWRCGGNQGRGLRNFLLHPPRQPRNLPRNPRLFPPV